MQLRLREELYHCICSGRSVFLDVVADRYFALPEKMDLAFQRFLNGKELGFEEEQEIAQLKAKKILVSAPAVRPRHRSPAPKLAQAQFKPEPQPVSLISRLRVAIVRGAARRDLRVKSLRDTLAKVRSRKIGEVGAAGDADLAISQISAAFSATNLIFRIVDQCLPDAIAFHQLCVSRGVTASLVIGVSINPFSAHCWLQRGGMVINDDVERIRQFTPILEI